mgnify:FL=1
MAITINGSGTIGGLSVGGLPAGTVNAASLAAGSVTTSTLAAGSVTTSTLAAGSVTNSILASSSVSVDKVYYTGAVGQTIVNNPTPNIYTMSVSSFTEITTDFRTSITPLRSNSLLILDFVCLLGGNNQGGIFNLKFYNITSGSDIQSASVGASRPLTHGSIRQVDTDANDRDNVIMRAIISAGSTSARTYSIYAFSEAAQTRYVGATATDNSGCSFVPSRFTITEIFQ